jgi:hypothetical protein
MFVGRGIMMIGGLGIVLGAGGCPLLDVQIEAPEVCLHDAGLEVPAGDGGGRASVSFTFDELSALDALQSVDGDVELRHVALHATSGVHDFAFLTSARASIATGDAASSVPPVTVVDCSGDACDREGATVTVDAVSAVNVIPYLRGDSLAITLDVAGDLPTASWTADVDVCLQATVEYEQSL